MRKMRIYKLVQLDSRGRVIIPLNIREAIGLREGMSLMAIADIEQRQVRLIPIADPEAKLAEFQIEISDAPGSLAKIASILAECGVDLISSESRTLRRGELAEWHAIADISKCKINIEKIKERIAKEKIVKDVKIQKFS